MHQRNQPIRETRRERSREGATGEAVDEQEVAGPSRGEQLFGRSEVGFCGKGKGAGQGEVAGLDAGLPPFAQKAPVVAVAASGRIDVAGNGEDDAAHASAPS